MLKLRIVDGYCPLSMLYTSTVGVPTTPYGNNADADIRPLQRLSHYLDINNNSDARQITNYGEVAQHDT